MEIMFHRRHSIKETPVKHESAHLKRYWAILRVELPTLHQLWNEKAFDSINRDTPWKLLRHYGIPTKLVNLIKNSYEGTGCRVIHGGQLAKRFEVKTGGRQSCLLSPVLFRLVVDWTMKTYTRQRRCGVQWTLWTPVDDLHLAEDLALLSHNHQHNQEKTSELAAIS